MINSHWVDKEGNLHVLTVPLTEAEAKLALWQEIQEEVKLLGYNSSLFCYIAITSEDAYELVFVQPKQLELFNTEVRSNNE